MTGGVLTIPDGARTLDLVRGVLGAITVAGGPTELQVETLAAIARAVLRLDSDVRSLEPADADALAAAVTDPTARIRTVQLMVLLELLLHPVPRALAERVERYAAALGVDEPSVHAARQLAHDQVGLMYADIQRNSWYTEETAHLMLHGRLRELVRSKLAYTGIAPDARLARKWEALGDCPPGSWGRGVHDFYREHHFPFPGERHGIFEVGARHDFVHVLAGYPPTPEGEIDVFAFIAAAMDDPRGFMQLVVTLGIFQNASIKHVAGKRVKIARADTLAEPGAVDRFAEALRRGAACTVDPMGGIDHFALAAEPLESLRARFSIPPKDPALGG